MVGIADGPYVVFDDLEEHREGKKVGATNEASLASATLLPSRDLARRSNASRTTTNTNVSTRVTCGTCSGARPRGNRKMQSKEKTRLCPRALRMERSVAIRVQILC